MNGFFQAYFVGRGQAARTLWAVLALPMQMSLIPIASPTSLLQPDPLPPSP
jgi:hypothetical protein